MSRYRGVAIACVCCVIAGPGCLAPYARYSQSAGGYSRTGMKSFKVPANWDYRKYYRVPVDRLKLIVEKYLGVPYRYGGSTPKGMDCSGFVKVVITELNHARMPRSSRAMSKLGRPVLRNEARVGDLVFFSGGPFKQIDHVGIYMGEGKFVHTSRKRGVTYSSLDDEYYSTHFAQIRRLF